MCLQIPYIPQTEAQAESQPETQANQQLPDPVCSGDVLTELELRNLLQCLEFMPATATRMTGTHLKGFARAYRIQRGHNVADLKRNVMAAVAANPRRAAWAVTAAEAVRLHEEHVRVPRLDRFVFWFHCHMNSSLCDAHRYNRVPTAGTIQAFLFNRLNTIAALPGHASHLIISDVLCLSLYAVSIWQMRRGPSTQGACHAPPEEQL